LLRSLSVRDYALIDELEVEFGAGLNVITGETGAGKSILLGALKLILGERASTESVRTGARKAFVEGLFDEATGERISSVLEENDIDPHPDGVVIVRREVAATHSRAFVNDTPATLGVLRDVAEELIDLHGQHEHQSLLRTERHVDLVDAFGALYPLREAYREAYDGVAALRRKRDEMFRREDDLRREKQLAEFQIEDIDRVGPQEGEEEELLSERRILENAERLHQAAATLVEILYQGDGAVYERLVSARNELRELARIDAAFDSTTTEIDQAGIAVEEAAKFLQDYAARVESNPERLEDIRARLAQIDSLKRKYGGSLEAVLELRRRIGDSYRLAANFEEELANVAGEIAAAQAELSRRAGELTQARLAAAATIEKAILEELAELGMPHAVFQVSIDRQDDPEGWIQEGEERRRAFGHGADRVEFFVSMNPGEPPRPLARVASGGEISRIMLALKSILARSERLPILVFDEIDVGVSGAIARRVGESMRRLAADHQIIAITHLPQIAALSDHHFLVEKTVEGLGDGKRTRTSLRKLSDDEHARQVASLVAGEVVTDAALASARELISAGRAPR
jgi:DNA repair protein RecN (Recombination protein N)